MKILIANRGEIALRIMRTARRLGHGTVAVYSDADRDAPHVAAADVAVELGAAPPAESYLAIDKVIAAAKATAADAIHPGYGFLAENAAFATACGEAGITFIGPPATAIELMGDKRAAKQAMKAAGVPCVPGYEDADQSIDAFTDAAASIGFPVMVKAAAGGGGRGMRRVGSAAELEEALRSARSEAENAFGDGTLLLEKAIDGARHVEIQVLADTQGNAIHLGERDCSVQRRHQKVFEESPSPAVDAALRKEMGAAAVNAATACNYVGAGTVEFLLDAEGHFYFLEMNTRLQVEHPVTEAVTGVDIVEEQLRVAEGEPLSLTQENVSLDGHAIEARLYAEDTERGFLPQTGTLWRWRPADTVRVDGGVAEGSRVSPHYDPMLAKVIAFAKTRADALRQLRAALSQTVALGVVTNKAFLIAVCDNETFAAGQATTAFIGAELNEHPSLTVTAPAARHVAAAAILVTLQSAAGLAEDLTAVGWRSGGPIWSAVHLTAGELRFETRVQRTGAGAFSISWDGDALVEQHISVVRHDEETLTFESEGVLRTVHHAAAGTEIWLDDGSGAHRFENVTHQPAVSADAAGSGRLVAPLDGAVTEVAAGVGDTVDKGALIMVIEAMKMEHRIEADCNGSVSEICVSVGQQVKTRQLLAEISPAS